MTLRERLGRSRFRGCLLGLSIGDALGAPVEFMSLAQIRDLYGPAGLADLMPWANEAGIRLPAGSITDDTQMAVATAAGAIDALSEWLRTGIVDPSPGIWQRYLTWLRSQDDPVQRRYPGTTCLSALRAGVPGDLDEPVNDSKGCGGIMRVAPMGLAFAGEQAFEEGARSAALTHGHPSGYLAAGFLATVISRLVRGAETGGRTFDDARGGRLPGAIAEAREILLGYDEHDEVLEKVDLAVELYIADADLDDGFEALGEGWIAEETLGIALFAALNHPEHFEEGVLSAVNITGDSDSTGAVTGALLGALLGEDALPAGWRQAVELGDTVACLADELYSGFVLERRVNADECLATE